MTPKQINAFIHRLKLEHYKRTKSSVPEFAIPVDKYDCTKTNGLTLAMSYTSKYLGGFLKRVNSTGIYVEGQEYKTLFGKIKGKGHWRTSPSTGIADTQLTLNGERWDVEVKKPGERQLPSQKRYQKQLEAAGGNYIIIRSFDEFIKLVESIL